MEIGDVSDYLAAILVVVGWVILYRQSLAIKRREEMLVSVDRATAVIDSLMALCRQYYVAGNTAHISYTSAQIKGEFHLLSRYLLILKAAGLNLDVTEAFVKFKMLATGAHFETTSFLQQLGIPNWEQDLTFGGLELRYLIDRAYFEWVNQKVSTAALLVPPQTVVSLDG